MAHRYGEVVRVEIAKTAPGEGNLRAFTWRSLRYPLADVLGILHPRDRWWERERPVSCGECW